MNEDAIPSTEDIVKLLSTLQAAVETTSSSAQPLLNK